MGCVARGGSAGSRKDCGECRWCARRGDVHEECGHGLRAGLGIQDANVPHQRSRPLVDRQLSLREEMANGTVVGGAVERRTGVAGLIPVRAPRERCAVVPSRQPVQAWAAEHHRRVDRDERGDQRWTQKATHDKR